MCNSDNKSSMHIPVLYHEVLDLMVPETGKKHFVDCTLGYGGHTELVLNKNKSIFVLGIDQDINGINFSLNRLSNHGARFIAKKGRFSQVRKILSEITWNTADYFLLDIGVSSPQIDLPERGFSYRFRGPLDMRMDSSKRLTAAQILNNYSFEELRDIFRNYGEIKQASKLARCIVERRDLKKWFDTTELANLCEKMVPPQRRGSLPLPTLCFQALRIAVNDELGELEKALKDIIDITNSKGRVGVISYHSLEDRIVKNIFKRESTDCICPPGLPSCVCGHKASLKLITKKPIVAKKDEIEINPRSRSAKFRVAEKV